MSELKEQNKCLRRLQLDIRFGGNEIGSAIGPFMEFNMHDTEVGQINNKKGVFIFCLLYGIDEVTSHMEKL